MCHQVRDPLGADDDLLHLAQLVLKETEEEEGGGQEGASTPTSLTSASSLHVSMTVLGGFYFAFINFTTLESKYNNY